MTTINKILCAVDFSEATNMIADYAKYCAEKFGAKVLALYAAPTLRGYTDFSVSPESVQGLVDSVFKDAEKRMDELIKNNFKKIDAKGMVLPGYAPDVILSTAEKEKCNLIVMGTHGRRGVDRIVFGSVAEKVVKKSQVPVLMVRPYK